MSENRTLIPHTKGAVFSTVKYNIIEKLVSKDISLVYQFRFLLFAFHLISRLHARYQAKQVKHTQVNLSMVKKTVSGCICWMLRKKMHLNRDDILR